MEAFVTEFSEFPIVISDADGVVDRAATVAEAEEYIASMPDAGLTFYDQRIDA